MKTSTQLPVRIALLILAGLFVLAEEFGFEAALGAFAAGMIVGQATKSAGAQPVREKIDAVAFGWFYPFFFVGMGVKFDMAGLVADLTIALMVPAFVLLFLLIRGAPVWFFYRKRSRAAAASAVRSPFGRSFSVDRDRHHRDRSEDEGDEFGRRIRADRRRLAGPSAVSDARQCRLAKDRVGLPPAPLLRSATSRQPELR